MDVIYVDMPEPDPVMIDETYYNTRKSEYPTSNQPASIIHHGNLIKVMKHMNPKPVNVNDFVDRMTKKSMKS